MFRDCRVCLYVIIGIFLGANSRAEVCLEPDWVLLPPSAIEKKSAVAERFSIDGFWAPNVNAIISLNRDLETYLAAGSKVSKKKDSQRRLKSISTHMCIYRCQYIGIIVDGRRKILINALPKKLGSGEDYFKERWRREYISVFDGGELFWEAVYDVASKSVDVKR